MLIVDDNGQWQWVDQPMYGAHNPHPTYLAEQSMYSATGNPDYYREDGSYVPAGTRPSSPSFIDKTAKVLVETMALLGMGAGAAGFLGAGGAIGGAGTAAGAGAVGDAAIAGGAGTDALAGGAALGGEASLGGGLAAGSTATGIGGGATGTGLTAGTTASGIGGGATGTGIGGASAGGALAPGYFASESLYPVMGGATAGAAGTAAGGMGAGEAAGAGGASSILSNPGAIGAGLGALGSILGGGSSPAGTTTTVQDIPEWLKPYALQGLSGLSEAYGMTPSGVAPITQAGNDYMMDVIGGDYLNSNPYLDAMFNRAAGQVGARVNSQFSGAGRYGSGAHAGVLTEGLGNLATDIYGGNYTRERALQQQAANTAPAFGNSIISQPFMRGQNLLNGVNSINGGTTSQPYFRNQAGEVLGGALGGMALGRMF